MKKRTLVCFLIFTLCVFHISIPDTVFGQDADPTPVELAGQVFDEHNQTLRRANVKQFLPEIFEGLKGDLPLGFTILQIIDLAITSVTEDPTGASLKATASFAGLTLTDDHVAIIADSDVQAVLEDDTTIALLSLTGDDLAAGLDELLRLINEAEVIEPTDPTTPTTPPTTTPTTPPTTTPTTPPTTTPTTPPTTTPTTPPTTTPTTPPTTTPTTPPTTTPVQPPEGPVTLVPSNLNGQSRLGGLSLNRVLGSSFIRELIKASGASNLGVDEDTLIEPIVDFILAQVPRGFLPKKQIKQLLTAKHPVSIFQNEAPQLDFENFGNALTPDLTEAIYTNVDNATKYLTDDNLKLYVRVPSTLEGGGVNFRINGQTVAGAERITPVEFQQDTIPYVFRLDESLAATNLPAWPGSNTDIFSGVNLRYSQTGLDGDYISVDMLNMGEGVWEREIGILPKGNTYYFFEVTLAEPVKLEVINRDALAQLISGKTDPVSATREYTIESWAMPDPRNLQLAQRGIIDALFTPDLTAAVAAALFSQEVAPLIQGVIAGQPVDGTALAGAINTSHLRKIQNIFLRNANELTNNFERNFDPLLASVFSVPGIKIETESLWFADVGSIADGAAEVEAVVYNANGDAIDHISVDINVDTTAPKATLAIGGKENATGYWNKDNVFVATAPNSGATSFLSITSIVTEGVVGEGEGYLIYQLIDLDEDGLPEGTWLPLTVESSLVASDVWDLVKGQLAGSTDLTLQAAAGLPLESVLPLLNADLIGTFANPFLKSTLGLEFTAAQLDILASLIGAVVADVDLIPVTSDPMREMAMPIQGENLPLQLGDYGLRAMGIDTRFNVGSRVPPTRLRIVNPEYDSSSAILASLGDINFNGKDDDYENNKIYGNARDVTLTIEVNERTIHPGTIMVEYENADGEWVTIGEPIDLDEAGHPTGTLFKHPWNVSDFDDLVGAGEYVRVRTVTTNGLQLTTMTPESDYLMIKLDPDVHPVDPKVLVVDVNDASIVMTNPDSEAPQGMIELIGYTPRRTVPGTASIRVEAKRMKDETWTGVGTVELSDPMSGMSGTDTAGIMFNGKSLADVYIDDMLHIQDSGSYLKWVITVDTTVLDDTIEMDNLAAAHAASNPEGTPYAELDTNRYMVRAYAVGDDGSDISDAVQGEDYTDMFSVDNVDDVAPLGQNIIAVSQDDIEVTANEDGSFTVGGLVDKYDYEVHSPVITLMITPEANRNTYETVNLYTSLPEGTIIGEVTETSEGSGVFAVNIDIGTLMDDDEYVHTDRYLEDSYIENADEFIYNPKGEVFSFTAYALAEDTSGNEQIKDNVLNADLSTTTAHEITVNVQNSYRPDPGVLAITVDNSDGMVNPDSKAPKYELTFNAYTYGLTSPPTEAVRFEVKRPGDSTWERITGTIESAAVSGADLDDIITGLIQITGHGLAPGGDSEFAIPGSFTKFSVTVDTRDLAPPDRPDEAIKLEDTIKRGDAAQRDVSLDDNQYQVRAIALTPKNMAHPEYPQRDGVDAHFSLDNVDDVPPLGPTNITAVSDRDMYGDMQPIEANEDGSYTVGGIVDPSLNSPSAIFNIEPTAEEITYAGGSLQLVQTAPDGTENVTDGSLEDGYIEIDVGALANGTYMYHALTVDEHGNVQVQGEAEMPSPVITVQVNNFRVSDIVDLAVTSVDSVPVDGELPERIPLRESISVSFNVPNGTLIVDDLTAVHVNGEQAAFDANSDAENAFSLMASELSKIASGHYTVRGEVTKRNGSVTFPLAMINLDNTVPIVTLVTPTEGATVSDLPTLQATYTDGDLGVGISLDTAMVSLARILPDSEVQEEGEVPVDQTMVRQDIDSVVYTRIDKLAGGAYKFTVHVADSLGNVGEMSVNFAVEGINPTVVITAPASGQEFEASPASVTGFFAGGGDVNITMFTVNDVDVSADVTVDGNSFIYMPADGFGEDAHQVTVEVKDGSGLTAQTALTFIVEHPVPTATIATPTAGQIYNHGMPIITGSYSGADPVMGTLTVSDSDGNAITEMEVSDNEFEYTPAEALAHGSYTVSIMVTDDNRNTADASTEFSVDIAGPSVAIHAPAAGQMFDHGMPVITVEASGEAEPVSVSVMVNGEAATMNEDGTYSSATVLGDGDHTVVATATDTNGKTAEATAIFSVEIPGPSIAIIAPAAGQMYDHGMPVITVESSGVAEPVSVSVMVNDEASTMNEDGTYSPATTLGDGDHTVVATATDVNGKTAEATAIFSVEIPGPSIAIIAPAAGQMYDHGMPVITVESSGVAEPVSVSVMVNGEAATMNEDGTYSPATALGDGDHTVVATATDVNGKIAEETVIFSVEIPGPSVVIHSPTSGQNDAHDDTVIRIEYSGIEAEVTTFTIDGEDVEVPEGNPFTYNAEDLGEGEHTVAVEVTDANGKTAEDSVFYNVEFPDATVKLLSPLGGHTFNHGKPVISGEYTGVGEVTVVLTVDNNVVATQPVGDNGFAAVSPELKHGVHVILVQVTDSNGETAQTGATFTVDIPGPSIAINAPAAGQLFDHGIPVITVESSGVAEPVSVSVMVNGEAATMNDDGTYSPATALGDGEHTVVATATDANDKTAEATVIFSVEIPGPSVVIHSPTSGQNDAHDDTVIRIEYSGIEAEVTTFTIDGEDVEVPEGNPFTYNAEDLGKGEHTVAVEVTDANGKTADDTVFYNVEFPEATVKLLSPLGGHIFNHGKPIISGEYTGVGEVTVVLTVDGNVVATQKIGDSGFVAESPELGHGDHTILVEVTDANGETAQTGASFTVDIPGPSVAILSPAPGQTYEHGEPVIRVEFSGMTEVSVTTFTINGEDVEGIEPEENAFEHTPAPALGDGEHKVVVEVTDENDKTDQASVVFSVAIPVDTTPPVISEVSPSGLLRLSAEDVIGEKFGVTISAIITDEQSDIISIEYAINQGTTLRPQPDDEDYKSYPIERADGKFEVSESFDLGTHQISLRVGSEGGVREFRWHFTLEADTSAPTISSISPSGTINAGMPAISASAADDSGVSELTIVVIDSNGENVEGETIDDGDDVRLNQGVTRIDFHPEAPLSEGTYSIEVRATDTYNNSSTASGVFTVDFDTAAPIITSSSPQNGARLMYKYNEVARPTISVTYGDAETGVDVDSIRLSIEGPGPDEVINLSDEQKSASQVVYTPPDGFKEPGQYSVILEVSDNANQQGNVSEESDDAREANHTVHKFSFFIEFEDMPVLMAPFNYPNPFVENTRISFGLNQMSVISIVIYDSTLRPVRVLVDNKLMPAGRHTGENGIGWDGKTSNGESLARGIYYCQIVVTGSFESEYAILKLALTGASNE